MSGAFFGEDWIDSHLLHQAATENLYSASVQRTISRNFLQKTCNVIAFANLMQQVKSLASDSQSVPSVEACRLDSLELQAHSLGLHEFPFRPGRYHSILFVPVLQREEVAVNHLENELAHRLCPLDM
jgi:hypothetical protein